MSDRKVKEKLLKFYYSSNGPAITRSSRTCIVFMVDGRIIHGGLSDRLRGMVSMYKFAKEHNYNFKIYHRYPFALEKYLQINKVDWHIDDNDIVYDLKQAQPVFIESLRHWGCNWTAHRYLCSRIKNDGRQYHVYTNLDLTGNKFNNYFSELFVPAPQLKEQIKLLEQEFGNNYIAMVFRFQQLLGDFKEGNYPILSENEQKILIAKCQTKMEEIRLAHGQTQKVLVTSDSSTFLYTINQMPNYMTIPGRVVHMDYSVNEQANIYLKSFIDLMMLSRAEKIYLLYTDKMFHSGFALRAARISGTVYEEIAF